MSEINIVFIIVIKNTICKCINYKSNSIVNK